MDFILDWLSKNFFSLIVAILTPLISYLVSRRKEESQIRKIDVESDSRVVDSAKDVVVLWENMSKQQDEKINRLVASLDERIKTLEKCEDEKNKLEKRIEELIIINDDLKKYNDKLMKALRLIMLEISKDNIELFNRVQSIILGFDIQEDI